MRIITKNYLLVYHNHKNLEVFLKIILQSHNAEIFYIHD